MFTPIEYFSDCSVPQLDYLNNNDKETKIAQKYAPCYDIDRDTGEYDEFETVAVNKFVIRYNLKAIKQMDKVIDYINDKDIQEYLQALNVDAEKFWYLLLFIYDYSVGQCLKNISSSSTSKEEIKAIIKKITDVVRFNFSLSNIVGFDTKEPVVLEIGKDRMSLNGVVAGLIADACEKYLEYSHSRYLTIAPVNFKPNNKGLTGMGYHFCYMIKWFFDSIGIKRRNGAKFSNKEKGLLCHLLYLMEIAMNKNILKYRENDYGLLKGFIMPKKKPEFNDINSYYYG